MRSLQVMRESAVIKVTPGSVAFLVFHVAWVAAFFVPVSWQLVALAAATYAIRMFAVTGGYHRYFSHRTYRLGRVGQFVMAFLAQSSAQKGVLWWAAQHRLHHRHADLATDQHSPMNRGFWWSHVGWILSDAHDDFDPALVRDLARYPEIRFISRHHWICPAVFGGIILAFGGWAAFVWGFLVSTVVLFHCTFTINSLAHLWGTRRYPTPDHSRNNLFLALITFGEGWHNNHHASMHACRQGERWWEVDLTYYVLRLLNWVGVVRDIRDRRSTGQVA